MGSGLPRGVAHAATVGVAGTTAAGSGPSTPEPACFRHPGDHVFVADAQTCFSESSCRFRRLGVLNPNFISAVISQITQLCNMGFSSWRPRRGPDLCFAGSRRFGISELQPRACDGEKYRHVVSLRVRSRRLGVPASRCPTSTNHEVGL